MTEVVQSLNSKSNLTNWIKRNQIISFILFTLFFSYLIGVPYSLWMKGFLEESAGFTSVYLQRLLTVYGPALAAITITYLTNRKSGVKNLCQKLIPSKKHWEWYLFLPVIASVITFTSFLIGGLSFINLTSIIADSWFIFFGHLILQTLIIGIGEELGWRGWLLPKLTDKYSLAVSILFISIIWGLWHFPILLSGPAIVMPWLYLLFSASIILTWIWLKVKGNIAVLVIAHASLNSAQFFLENQFSKENAGLILQSWEINGYIYLVMAGFFLFLMRKILNKNVKLDNGTLKINDVQPKL